MISPQTPYPTGVIVFALNVLLITSMACLASLAAVRIAFRRNPCVRYTVCLAGVTFVLISPVLVFLQTRMGWSFLTLSLPHYQAAPGLLAGAGTSELPGVYSSAIAAPPPNVTTYTCEWLESWSLMTVWCIGSLCGVTRFIRGSRAALIVRRTSRRWRPEDHLDAVRDVRRVLRMPITPPFTSSRIASPMSVGVLRPIVILPQGLAEAITPTQLRHILLHEYSHVAYRHTVGGIAARVMRIVFWPNPLVSALAKELAYACEEVCDNVASQEDGAACYARTLLAIAQGVFPAPHITSSLALLGPETSLEERIYGLLDPRRNRMVKMKNGRMWAVTGVVICAAAAMFGVRVVAAAGKADHVTESNAASAPLAVKSTSHSYSWTRQPKTYSYTLARSTSKSASVQHTGARKPISSGTRFVGSGSISNSGGTGTATIGSSTSSSVSGSQSTGTTGDQFSGSGSTSVTGSGSARTSGAGEAGIGGGGAGGVGGPGGGVSPPAKGPGLPPIPGGPGIVGGGVGGPGGGVSPPAKGPGLPPIPGGPGIGGGGAGGVGGPGGGVSPPAKGPGLPPIPGGPGVGGGGVGGPPPAPSDNNSKPDK